MRARRLLAFRFGRAARRAARLCGMLAAPLAAQSPETGPAVDLSSHRFPPPAASGAAESRATEPPLEIDDDGVHAFGFPSPALSASERRAFSVGNAFFRRNWTGGPSSAPSNDGLGPFFNARSCSGCHLRDGRSRPPVPGETFTGGLLLRLGIPRAAGPDLPEPLYGGQLQDDALDGLRAEGRVILRETSIHGAYGDGTPFTLTAPAYAIGDPAYGAPSPHVVLGPRTAPHLVGLGLLEAIAESDLLAAEDPRDRDGDGVSGRVARLALPDGVRALGRFGWKATQPDVHRQTVAAFAEDLGLTTAEFPHDPGPPDRPSPLVPSPPELDARRVDRTVFYTRFLAPPRPRRTDDPAVLRGEARFQSLGCAACHRPSWTTGDDAPHPGYRRRAFRPYTDLLLHDLGPALADGKRDGDASPSEWRTPPLWGLGLLPTVSGHLRLLHDGRARGFAEAILWHGGEAEAARERFRLAAAADRADLIAFLESR